MKLGLIRHFKVIKNEKYFLSTKEFVQAMSNYDVAPVSKNGLIINSDDWDVCYCSTLSRAITTAESIYNKEIIKTDLLIEVPISPFTKRNIKLPITFWHIGARIAWYKKYKSQIENRDETRERISEFYKMIKDSGHENILIVSHGYFLRMFYEEMKKKRFSGEIDLNIQNGKLYILEN